MSEIIAKQFLESSEGIAFKQGKDDLYPALGKYMGRVSTAYELPNPIPIGEAVKKIISTNKQEEA